MPTAAKRDRDNPACAWDRFTVSREDRVCVIGAGVCGITCAQALKVRDICFDVYEKGSQVGGLWRYENDNGRAAAYSSLFINTSKKRSQCRTFPMPDHFPHYPHHTQIAQHLDAYTDYFGLRSDIRFATEVTHIEPRADGRWQVHTNNGEDNAYGAVIVCNGHHWKPRWPAVPGRFDGMVMHSHDYRTPEPFEDKRVVVVGFGNSAVDIAVESSRVSRMTYLSVRRGAHVLPKFVRGRPIDQMSTPLTTRLPWPVRRVVQYRPVLKIINGDMTSYGLPVPDHKLAEAHPTISQDLLSRIGHGRIKPMPQLTELCGERVRFADGRSLEADMIVHATGYDIAFPFIGPGLISFRDNDIQLFQRMLHPDLGGLFFVGLVEVIGAIQPVAEAQAGWVCDVLSGRVALPDRRRMIEAIDAEARRVRKRFVPSARHTIEIDVLPYIRRLERQRGARRGKRSGEPLYPICGGAISEPNEEALLRAPDELSALDGAQALENGRVQRV